MEKIRTLKELPIPTLVKKLLRKEAIKHIKRLAEEFKSCSCHSNGCDYCWKCEKIKGIQAWIKYFFNAIKEVHND